MLLSAIAGKGYATDGRRMHIVKDVGVADGVYRIAQNTKDAITLEPSTVTPPPYEQVIPKADELSRPFEIVAYGLEAGAKAWRVLMALAQIDLAKTLPTPRIFNLNFVLDALDIEQSGEGVYGISITNLETGEEVDSCWGFYDSSTEGICRGIKDFLPVGMSEEAVAAVIDALEWA
jgi:hypothetical protein